MRFVSRLLVITVLTVLLSISSLQNVLGANVTITPPDGDAVIAEAYPDSNSGSWGFIEVGRFSEGGGSYIRRGLVKFDLSSIPAGSIVTSASLKLFTKGSTAGVLGTGEFFVYRVTHDWVEGDGTSGVTWNEANHVTGDHPDGCTSWTAGGEWTTEDSASSIYMYLDWWMTWDVKGIVEDWLSGTDNYGFIIRYPTAEEGAGTLSGKFRSKEPLPGNVPKLVVTYIPPPTFVVEHEGSQVSSIDVPVSSEFTLNFWIRHIPEGYGMVAFDFDVHYDPDLMELVDNEVFFPPGHSWDSAGASYDVGRYSPRGNWGYDPQYNPDATPETDDFLAARATFHCKGESLGSEIRVSAGQRTVTLRNLETGEEMEMYPPDHVVVCNQQPAPSNPYRYVGGELFTANKLAVLSPYLALIGLVGILTAAVAIKRYRT
ncbi:MAG: DNRLRE domain-containing protein [Candidatus Bathyarchaeia archaeon]